MGARSVFGTEMRRLRTESGMTRAQLAGQTPYKGESIKSFESGHRTPTLAIAVALDRVFDTKGLFAAMQREAEQEKTPFGELRENEQRATVIRIWDLRVIPGLLQTEEYASAILSDPEAVGRRMQRQEIFTREEPPRMSVIICERVLYQEIGGLGVLRRQLEQLIRPDAPWTLQVMPQTAGWHIGLEGPITLLEFADEDPAAFVDGALGGSVADDPRSVAEVRSRWDRLTAEAMSPDMSREMIEAVIAELPEEPNVQGMAYVHV